MGTLHVDSLGIYGDASHLDGVYVRGSTDTVHLNVSGSGGRGGFGRLLSLGTSVSWVELQLDAAETMIVAQIAWNENSSTVSGVSTIFNLRNGAGSEILTLYRDNTAEVLVLKLGGTGGTTLGTGATVITGTVWHFIELRAVLHDTTGEAEVRVNGASQFTFNGNTEGAAGGCERIRLGGGTAATGGGQQAFCDFVLNNVGFIGDRAVDVLPVATDLATMDWVQSTGGTVEGVLDEIPANGDTDFATADTDGQRSEFDTTDPAYDGTVTITAAQTYAIARQENAGSHGMIVGIGSGGVYDDTVKQTMTTAYRSYKGTCRDTNPDTSSAWLPGEFPIQAAIEYAA